MNVIIGRNDIGKSTILEALELFDKAKIIKTGRNRWLHMIRDIAI